jgi:hypothetical protein
MEPGQLKALLERYNQEEEATARQLQIQEDNADYRAALICTVIANCFRDPKRRAFKVDDFLPRKKEVKSKTQTPEEQMMMVQMWQAMYGGK